MIKYSDKHMFSYLKDYDGQTIREDVVILNEIYYNPESNYGVYEVAIEDEYIERSKTFSVAGNFKLRVDRTYQLSGLVFYDSKYGFQLKDAQAISKFPESKETVKRLLSSLHGIGPQKASILVANFGEKALKILLEHPEEITQISGVSIKTIEKARKHLLSEKEKFSAIENLAKAGLHPKISTQLFSDNKTWKSVYKKIQKNPYQLIDSGNTTFKKADELANILGLLPSNENRLIALVINILKINANNNGSCYLNENLLRDIIKQSGSIFVPEDIQNYITIKKNNVTFKYFNLEKDYKTDVYLKYKDSIAYKNDVLTNTKYTRTVFAIYTPSDEEINNILEIMILKNLLYKEDDKIFLDIYYNAENNVAKNIMALKSNKINKFTIEVAKKHLDEITAKEKIFLSKDQEETILNLAISDSGFALLLGSAGCGKTFCLNIFIKLYIKLRKLNNLDINEIVTILAPTGRASKVASEATHIQGATIHRGCGLGVSNGDEKVDMYTPSIFINSSIVIIDETSMLDIRLTNSLLESISKTSKVIFVGDIKQLAPVGAGRVLFDIIYSKTVNIYTLKTIQRQKENSGIIYNANKIIDCKMIEYKEDCKILFENSDAEITRDIYDDFKISLEKYKKIEDIQIISPMWNKANGVYALNYEIQKMYNPIKEDDNKKLITTFMYNSKMTGLYLHKGDKVINVKNDSTCVFYKRVQTPNGLQYKPNGKTQITNGEIGIVKGITHLFSTEFYERIEVVIVEFDDGFAFFYEKSSEQYCLLSNLTLAYAITIHKAQGSQWKHVIIPLSKNHSIMVTNNLLYTAITRAQESATICCDKRTVENGINKFTSMERLTTLEEKLITYN